MKDWKEVQVFLSDDYATLSSGAYRFYYGWEYTDEEDNWQFHVRKSGEQILRATPTLPSRLDGADPHEILLYCIGVYILRLQEQK